MMRFRFSFALIWTFKSLNVVCESSCCCSFILHNPFHISSHVWLWEYISFIQHCKTPTKPYSRVQKRSYNVAPLERGRSCRWMPWDDNNFFNSRLWRWTMELFRMALPFSEGATRVYFRCEQMKAEKLEIFSVGFRSQFRNNDKASSATREIHFSSSKILQIQIFDEIWVKIPPFIALSRWNLSIFLLSSRSLRSNSYDFWCLSNPCGGYLIWFNLMSKHCRLIPGSVKIASQQMWILIPSFPNTSIETFSLNSDTKGKRKKLVFLVNLLCKNSNRRFTFANISPTHMISIHSIFFLCSSN